MNTKKHPILKCPRCKDGKMLYDNLEKEWECILCSCVVTEKMVKEMAKNE
jgi:transcription initiation factor TFIIIB Brf1 subunit/transcription initiation factor TFIIB